MNKVIKAEIISTRSEKMNKEYSGEGNFQGTVVLILTYEDGSTRQQEIDGEISEKDMLVNLKTAEYWNYE